MAEGRASLPLPAPVEASASRVGSWILETYSGGRRGRAHVSGMPGDRDFDRRPSVDSLGRADEAGQDPRLSRANARRSKAHLDL